MPEHNVMLALGVWVLMMMIIDRSWIMLVKNISISKYSLTGETPLSVKILIGFRYSVFVLEVSCSTKRRRLPIC